MLKILITGAGGQLGRELADAASSRSGLKLIPTERPHLDITDASAVYRAIQESGASLVVNAAAYTAVDQAESHPGEAFAVNRDGAAVLADACAGTGIPLIHVSTDYVFDGTGSGAYTEMDPVSPLGVYGKSKAAGESEIRRRLPAHIVLRTAWLYSVHGSNFVKTMLRLGAERETLRVVADQHGCPTHAADLARAVFTLADRYRRGSDMAWGTYHFCGRGATTWHGFAETIFRLAGKRGFHLKVKSVEPVTTADYPTQARRPGNSVLDCTRIENTFGIRNRPWEECLEEMLHSLSGRKR